MTGSRQQAQSALFCELSIETDVPADHMLRAVDRFADLAGIRQHLAPFYSSTGWQPGKIDPGEAPRADREYLATLDDAAFGAASPVEPKFTSHSGPAPQWTGARGGPACFAHSTNYLTDTDSGVILDVEATRSVRQAEVGSLRTMIDRVSDSFGLKPERLIADTAYGTGDMLHWLGQKRGIAPHIPVFDKSARRDGTFERTDFTYDAEQDTYACPGGKELKQNRRAFTEPREKKPDEDGMLRYRASKADCEVCDLKSRGCPKEPSRKVLRSIYKPSRDRARAIARTTEYAISCKPRKKVEMLFAHLKRILGLSRLRSRGPLGARDAFHLAATARNLR
ncbi:transposase [Puniceibacterium confluentis]|uniref:transposase n=1 Tax=Puniceibacterium confluentis TaxID=1958944 RepID=UPI0011B56FD2|nr:transposase [Puniceibacterium confluentis]